MRKRTAVAIFGVAALYLCWWVAMRVCGPGVVRHAAHAHMEWLLVAARIGGVHPDEPDLPRVPALYLANLEQDPVALEMLLRHGANPELTLEDSSTPVIVDAVEHCGLPCVRVFAEHGADLNSGAVMEAEERGKRDIVDYLVAHGAHPGPMPPDGLPPVRLKSR